MFPAFPKKNDPVIDELKNQLLLGVGKLGSTLPPVLRDEVANFMVRITSYYTNAMEGNPSRLKDIEEALNNKLAPADSPKRQYQLEHVAHIETQRKMLARLDSEPTLEICSKEFICWLHQEFYEKMPPELRFALTETEQRIAIIPGELRTQGARVGSHHAPKTKQEIEIFLNDFRFAYSYSNLSVSDRLLAFAASHHRLLWIHPFPDGNGRVVRLFTDAYAHRIGISGHSLWSVTRAFARKRTEYDFNLALADRHRRNDYDGRGPLSEEDLGIFCKFFLTCSVDQVEYMNKLLITQELHHRFGRYIAGLVYDKSISNNIASVLTKISKQGEVARKEVASICRVETRQASNIIRSLLALDFVQSPSHHSPLRLKFTNDLALALFPGLVD